MTAETGPEPSDRRRRRRWRPWQVVVAAGLALGVGVFVLVWFQPQKLFLNERVDEALPVAAAPTDDGEPAMDDEMSDDMSGDDTMEDAAAGSRTEPMESMTFSGTFEGRSHPTSGTARVVEPGDGSRVLRLEDFATDNGPDLLVYLSSAPPDAPAGDFDDDFVDLGRLKGNLGNQNYEIPADVDVSEYSTVVIWCRRFTVVFGVAPLSA
ncbi:MAG: DM13 domain-containing protein [Nitriliruptorales bacterium]